MKHQPDGVVPTPEGAAGDLPVQETLRRLLWYTEIAPPAIIKQRQIRGWIEKKVSTADITLSTTITDVTGCTLTLPHIGEYLIIGTFDFHFSVVPGTGSDNTAIGYLADASNNAETGNANFQVPSVDTLDNSRATVSQSWHITTTAINTVYKLQVQDDVAVANQTVIAKKTHTSITGIFIARDITIL